jgi:DHA2 family multidrug resistance protein
MPPANTGTAEAAPSVPAPVPAPVRAAGLSQTKLMIITGCTVLATLIQALDTTIANVALPYMQGSMAASQDQINWVLTSYIVAAAIMTAPTGFLATRFGRTRLFVVAISGFTVASVLCGLSQTLTEIVLCRILQGMFGAALAPLSQAVLYDLYPPEKRGAAMAVWGMGIQIGPILGPILGGFLTQHYSWRWVFYVNVPFGILAALGLLVCLKETAPDKATKLDWLGFGALSLAIGTFQMMLDRGEQLDWFSAPEIIIEATLAGLSFYIFLVQSSLAPKPFLPPFLFADRNFAVSLILMFDLGLTLFATLALQAPYLQLLMNYPVISAGVALAPRGAGTILAMVVASRLLKYAGPRAIICCGVLANIYALYEMIFWTPDVSEFTIIIVGLIQGLSMGFIFVPLSAIVFATLPLESRTLAASVFSLSRNLGSAIGISITGSLLQSNTQINHAIIAGVVTPFNRIFQGGAVARLLNPHAPGGAALLDAAITSQASIIAYGDDYKLMLVLTLITLPLVLLINPLAKSGGGAPAVAMD